MKLDADDIYVAFHEGRLNSSDEYYPAADYEALEAELARVRVLYAKEVNARIYAEKLLMNEPCTVQGHAELEAKLAALVEMAEKALPYVDSCEEYENLKSVIEEIDNEKS